MIVLLREGSYPCSPPNLWSLISFVESGLPSPLLEENARSGLKCNIGSDMPKKLDMLGSAKWLASSLVLHPNAHWPTGRVIDGKRPKTWP